MTLFFGGETGSGVMLNQTWIYWSNQSLGPAYWVDFYSPFDSPPALAFASMDYDQFSGLFVLFGGLDAQGSATNGTWLFSPITFTWSNDSASACRLECPSVRQSAAMAFDSGPSGSLTVLFGGCFDGCQESLSDTWYFVSVPPYGSHWSIVSPPLGPSARFGVAFASASLANRDQGLVLFGGAPSKNSSNRMQDTWEFSAGNWTNLSSQGALTGSPPGLVGASMTYDWGLGGVVLVGGIASFSTISDQTWQFQCIGANCTWNNLSASAHGPSVAFAAIMTDTWSTEPFLVGGQIGSQGATTNATWVFQNATDLALNVSSQFPETGQTIDLNATVLGGANAAGRGDHAFSEWWYGPAGESPGVLFGGWPSSSKLQFPTAGTWYIDATGFDLFDVAITERFVLLVVAPIASATASVLATDVGFPIVFHPSLWGEPGSDEFTYLWDFGDGELATVPDPTHSYAFAGSFVASVRITDLLGGVGHARVGLTVHSALVISATANATTLDPGGSVHFAAAAGSGTPPYQYRWDFGDGLPNGSSSTANHSYFDPGVRQISLLVTDAVGDRATASLNLSVNAPLAAQASSDAVSVELGTPVQFNASATGGTSTYQFTWLFGDQSGAPGVTVTHTYGSPGNYVATVWVNDTLRASTRIQLIVHVSPPPATPGASPWWGIVLTVGGFVAVVHAAERLRFLQRRGSPRARSRRRVRRSRSSKEDAGGSENAVTTSAWNPPPRPRSVPLPGSIRPGARELIFLPRTVGAHP
jgi:PKD repeat protein